MSYSIRPLYFAPILKSLAGTDEKVHAIVYKRCNFNCNFCTIHLRPQEEFQEYSEDEFVVVASQLIRLGKSFKFTGGEPTLNPTILRDTQIIKDLGGRVFLDTNGSIPIVVNSLIRKKLVDLISVSLKGLSATSARRISNCKNVRLCWSNVLDTIRLSLENDIKTIVTYVFDSTSDFKTLCDFVDLFDEYGNIIFKINNLYYEELIGRDLKKVQEEVLLNNVKRLVEQKPQLKNRIVLSLTEESVNEYSSIIFL